MPPCSHITDTIARGEERGSLNDWPGEGTYYPDMDEKPPHYARQWREAKKINGKPMTQQQLADALGTSKSVISDLERFVLQLSPKWARRLADALDTQPGHILDHDPEELPADVFDIWSKIAPADRDQAKKVLKSFVRTGTDG